MLEILQIVTNVCIFDLFCHFIIFSAFYYFYVSVCIMPIPKLRWRKLSNKKYVLTVYIDMICPLIYRLVFGLYLDWIVPQMGNVSEDKIELVLNNFFVICSYSQTLQTLVNKVKIHT